MTGKHPYISSLLETINFIRDEKYQERVWVRAEGPECNSYTETINTFFEEFEPLEPELQEEEYGLTDSQITLLEKFARKLDAFNESVPGIPKDKEILKDPRWIEIREFAKKVYDELSA